MKESNDVIFISTNVIKSLSKDHPFRSNKHFQFFIESILNESFMEFPFEERQVSVFISAYEYFSQGKIPKIRVVNKSNLAVLKNSTIIEAHARDIKFLLDSIREYLNEFHYKTKLIINPIFSCTRNESGELINLKLGTEGIERESFIHIEIEKVEEDRVQEMKKELDSILLAVQHSVEDFKSMISKLKELNQQFKKGHFPVIQNQDFSIYEAVTFLDWLLENNFIFLGYRCYNAFKKDSSKKQSASSKKGNSSSLEFFVQVEEKSTLGLLRNDHESAFQSPVAINTLPERMKERFFLQIPLLIDKAHRKSNVHRRVPMDLIEIREFDENGIPLKWHRFLGLFTRKALFSQAKDIPMLSTKLDTLIESNHIVEGSTMFREMLSVFDSLPKEVLFFTSIKELDSLIKLIISAYRTQTIRLFVRSSLTSSAISIVVALPEKYLSSSNMAKISRFLKTVFNAKTIQYYQTRSHPGFWEIHYFLSFYDDGDIPIVTLEVLEKEVTLLLKEWKENLQELIESHYSNYSAERIIQTYVHSFPNEYQSTYPIQTALRDISFFEIYCKTGKNQYDFIHPGEDVSPKEAYTILRVYSCEKISLTAIMPILENLGLKVIDESAYYFKFNKAELSESKTQNGLTDIHLYVFAVTDMEGEILDPSLCGGLLEETLGKVIDNQFEDGQINALVAKTGMNYKQINLLRTYYNYYFQIERIFTRKTVVLTMIQYSHFFKLIFRFFDLKFNPNKNQSEKEAELLAVQDDILDLLKGINDINQDRILKAFYNLVDSTIRTNYFMGANTNLSLLNREDNFLISIKIESKKVFNMPTPKPLYEIYVYSRAMEGIHLRGGMIARGGLRFSDRIDDYRTEVLALMKTQMTKNAVIVPEGSKGGFIIRTDNSKDPNVVKKEYQNFISGLLDVTDSIINGKVVHPKNVVCYDGEDPYLVVAADKGTAHLSDAANEVSGWYNFWLGDAFASGGSQGYDHKEEGITAKGAWECVKRHFRETGKNIQEEEFSVVGIGDMSGDVFGNGMLLSKKILLNAVFNHIHIFIDLNPDAEASYKERERLFNLPRSSWKDYNPKLISKGGGLFLRNDKAIPLSKEMKAFLNTDLEKVSGNKLIRLILKADIELLWNGGIGTYIKASNETHEQVSDKSNDHVRINANELKAKVVGEGGNLGFTQLARVEYAYLGGCINTDAIDNSAGVDMSDHEVNLKILCNQLKNDGLIKSMKERNQFLAGLTIDLNHMIVKDNYLQSLTISIDSLRSSLNIDRFKELIDNLVQEDLLDTKSEFIPTDKEIASYKAEGKGLLRPQLSVLMAYEKQRVYKELLSSEIPDLPYCNKYLISYFPDRVYAKFKDHILKHQLKREIIATVLTNHVINSAGITFFYELKRGTGLSYADITGALLVIEDLLDISDIRQALHLLDFHIPTREQYGKLRWTEKLIRFMVSWNLTFKQCTIPDEKEIESLKEMIWYFQAQLQETMSDNEKAKYEQRLEIDLKAGFPKELAKKILAVDSLENVFMCLSLAQKFNRSLLECHNLLIQVDEKLKMQEIIDQMRQVRAANIWDQITEFYLRVEFQFERYYICKKIFAEYEGLSESFFKEKKGSFEYYHHWVDRLKHEETTSFQPFTVILKFMRNLMN